MDATTRTREEMGAGTLLAVWATLVTLTGALVAANHWAPGNPGIVAVLVITPTKAALVGWYFMHLKFERRTMGILFASTLILGMILVSVGIGELVLPRPGYPRGVVHG